LIQTFETPQDLKTLIFLSEMAAPSGSSNMFWELYTDLANTIPCFSE
jgi:hypothetical protein